MSNGFAGFGSVAAELEVDGQDPRKGQLGVRQGWSSSAGWTELIFFSDDDRKAVLSLYIESDNDESVELVASLLGAIDKVDMATALRADSEKLEQRAKVRRLAEGEFRRATGKAEKRFLDGVTPQREAYAAEIAAAEKSYEDATGERMGVSGLIHVLDQKRF